MIDRLVSIFLTCASDPRMLAQNYGGIVNLESIADKEGNPNASAYSASNAAVTGFTKALIKEVARQNISVNAVTPGRRANTDFQSNAANTYQLHVVENSTRKVWDCR